MADLNSKSSIPLTWVYFIVLTISQVLLGIAVNYYTHKAALKDLEHNIMIVINNMNNAIHNLEKADERFEQALNYPESGRRSFSSAHISPGIIPEKPGVPIPNTFNNEHD